SPPVLVSTIGAASPMYFFEVIPNANMGHPPPPPPSIRGRSLSICVVDAPYLSATFLPRLLNIFCRWLARVIITPTSITRRSNSNRKLFRSRSKKGSLLFHSISNPTLPLKQSTLCVGESLSSLSTTIFVANFVSFHCLLTRKSSIRWAITLFLPPPFKTSLRLNSNAFKTSMISCHSLG